MIELATDQITIVDITDAYSVMLSNDSYVFPGTTDTSVVSETTTKVTAMIGADIVPCSVIVANITKPLGVTVSSDNHATSPTLTVAVNDTVTAGGLVRIPVTIGETTLIKEFSFSIAFIGADGDAGPAGPGAISITVTSTTGFVFKNTAIATTLTAHVYVGGVLQTGIQVAAMGVIKWYKDNVYLAGKDGLTLVIVSGDVISKADYTVQLEG